MTTLAFWKMVGAGNDFVVVDARGGLPRPAAELARALCPRRTAVGADGLIAVTSAAGDRVEVDFVNADGSPAAFCGNGSRCVVRYALRRGLARGPMTVVFPGLTVTGDAAGDDVRVVTPRPRVTGAAGRALVVDAGVPHALLEDDGARPLRDVAEAFFAEHPALRENINLTLVRREDEGRVRVRTLERGAGETLACGSAALAAALFAAADRDAPSRTVVIPPAGVPLTVALDAAGGGASLTGEARVVYRAELDL